jgi:1,4-alpha-glucan branching enzyme
MPGDEWQRFANLRLLFTYMYTHPGKKLLFMGSEFGQGEEWDSQRILDWYVLEYPLHQGIQQLVRRINRLYQEQPPLHQLDFNGEGFEWIDCHDAHNSVLIYQRKGQPADDNNDPLKSDHLVVALNFTPIPRHDYRVGVPAAGAYQQIFNSDASAFGGSGVDNGSAPISTEPVHWMNHPQSLLLTLPPLAGIVLKPLPTAAAEHDETAEAAAD